MMKRLSGRGLLAVIIIALCMSKLTVIALTSILDMIFK
jgi:hypothetical protein